MASLPNNYPSPEEEAEFIGEMMEAADEENARRGAEIYLLRAQWQIIRETLTSKALLLEAKNEFKVSSDIRTILLEMTFHGV